MGGIRKQKDIRLTENKKNIYSYKILKLKGEKYE